MKHPKGQIFLMSMLILSVVLTAGLALTLVFIKDLRQSTETSASVQAFYGADSAIEWQLYQKLNSSINTSLKMTNGVGFEVSTSSPTCVSPGCLQAIGFMGNVRRGIEVNF